MPRNALEELIRARIAADGPLSVADYMALALGHPEHGYYRSRDPLGAAGDFVTAPEISQMFGELIGLWCAAAWEQLGRPSPVALVELGPGRGTLMADALRAVGRMAPDFAFELHLVETSLPLRQRQAARLAPRQVTWHDDLATLPAMPLLAVANELLDALPIHQLERTAAGWCERTVDVGPDGLIFATAAMPSPLAGLLDEGIRDAPEGSLAEVSPAVADMVAALARRITARGGAAVLIDYGYAAPATGDSLQAVRGHRFHEVLQDPGEADLTAHVDFSAVARAAVGAGASVQGPVAQGLWLRRLGILARAERLAAGASAETARSVRAGLARLIEPTAMGTLFKAIAIAPPGLSILPGFDT